MVSVSEPLLRTGSRKNRRGCESIRTLCRTKPCRGNPRILMIQNGKQQKDTKSVEWGSMKTPARSQAETNSIWLWVRNGQNLSESPTIAGLPHWVPLASYRTSVRIPGTSCRFQTSLKETTWSKDRKGKVARWLVPLILSLVKIS